LNVANVTPPAFAAACLALKFGTLRSSVWQPEYSRMMNPFRLYRNGHRTGCATGEMLHSHVRLMGRSGFFMPLLFFACQGCAPALCRAGCR
jgi:hypothetical protein